MTADEEVFLQQILEDRDRLFQETSRLKGQLTSYENFEFLTKIKLPKKTKRLINWIRPSISWTRRSINWIRP